MTIHRGYLPELKIFLSYKRLSFIPNKLVILLVSTILCIQSISFSFTPPLSLDFKQMWLLSNNNLVCLWGDWEIPYFAHKQQNAQTSQCGLVFQVVTLIPWCIYSSHTAITSSSGVQDSCIFRSPEEILKTPMKGLTPKYSVFTGLGKDLVFNIFQTSATQG